VKPRRRRARAAMAFALLLLAGGFVALGVWQLERRVWKHALIAAVDARSRAAPVPAPGAGEWPRISANRDAYRRIRATGHFLQHRRTLVRAVTDLGAGYWVLAPLDTGRFTLLVNRGFIAQDRRGAGGREPQGVVTVTGLLRITEPGGGFLRSNDPAADRWYSRDVTAIASARAIPHPAPYFLDADATRNAPGEPVGGLTVVRFADNHLSYALTWFAMAGLCLWGLWRLMRTRDDAEDARLP
jgi:surfeit locus 1 family protein